MYYVEIHDNRHGQAVISVCKNVGMPNKAGWAPMTNDVVVKEIIVHPSKVKFGRLEAVRYCDRLIEAL